MEIGDNNKLQNNAHLVVRKFEASDGIEYYISFESNTHYNTKYYLFLMKSFICSLFNKTIYWDGDIKTYNGLIGFCRLRLDKNPGGNYIPELYNSALIREVHVYGQSLGVNSSTGHKISSQHKGYGRLLVKTAEDIALANNYYKTAIIAGVGTREYYKNKCGYHLEGTYMVKKLKKKNTTNSYLFLFFLVVIQLIHYLF